MTALDPQAQADSPQATQIHAPPEALVRPARDAESAPAAANSAGNSAARPQAKAKGASAKELAEAASWAWGGDLAACPSCDLLHRVPPLHPGEKAVCARCHALVAARRPKVFERLLAVAMTNLILMAAALWFPFITMSRAGIGREIRVLDAPFALASGPTAFIALTAMANIILVPLLRSLAIAYVATPMVFGAAPPRYAPQALRLWIFLRPWSMAEIFMLGVAVSAIKVGGMAKISLGPGFWAFAALLPTLAFENAVFHAPSIWREMGRRRSEAAAKAAALRAKQEAKA